MKTRQIASLLHEAHQQLLFSSDTPMLDAEILLAAVLQVSRSFLFAFPERELTAAEIISFEKNIELRKQKMPVAYITGHKEFWSLDLIVTRDTLIPRPETELLVEQVLQEVRGENKSILDLGTGSGAIALAIAQERPSWEIVATDASIEALGVAKENAARFHLSNIQFYQGNWFEAVPADKKFDAIVSNPPYIALNDPDLQDENRMYEPSSALIAEENGLKDLHDIIVAARQYLKPGGLLLLEHGFKQAAEVRGFLANLYYSGIDTYQDLAGLDRVTKGCV